MSRTNLILLAVLVVFAAIWMIGRDWDEGSTSVPAPRLFPDFNKEAVDEIVIEGGWQKTRMALARTGSEWRLASAGDYPVKKDAVDEFIDAAYNLRKLNVLGTSADLQKNTHTDVESGRMVTVLRDGAPMARFLIGRNPKGAYQEVFVRVDGDETVIRDRTILTKDKDAALPEPDQPFGGGGSQGFQWHNYLNNQSTRWVETKIWDLAGAEPIEIWLTRRGELDVKLKKKSDDSWDLIDSGKDPVPGDADAADGILSTVRTLSLYEVVGTYEQAAEECGLAQPEMTLVMTLRKRIESKEGEGNEDEEKDEPKPEYITINRILEVGTKVKRPRFDSYQDEYTEDEYYPIRIGPRDGFDDPGEERRTNFVFLVNSYKISPLMKNLADLKAEERKETEEEGAEEDAGRPDDLGEKKDDESAGGPDKEKEADPEKEEATDPEQEEATDPEQDEPPPPKKDEPADPEKDEPPPEKDDQ